MPFKRETDMKKLNCVAKFFKILYIENLEIKTWIYCFLVDRTFLKNMYVIEVKT